MPDHYAKLTRAVVEIGTQLRRLADAHTTTVADAPATTCSAQHHRFDPIRDCIRAAHHTGLDHVDEHGFHWSDTVAVYPVADAPTTTPYDDPRCVCGDPIVLSGDPARWIHGPGAGTPALDAHTVRPVPAADHAPYLLRVLADRAARGALSLPGEGEALRRRVEQAIDRGDQLRAQRDQVEELLRVAHETSNRSEAERARAVRRAERAEEQRDKLTTLVRDIFASFNTIRSDGKTIGYQGPYMAPDQFEDWMDRAHDPASDQPATQEQPDAR